MRKSAPLFCALLLSLSARRAWIEIASCRRVPGRALSLSARRAWIEMAEVSRCNQTIIRSLSARRAWIEIHFMPNNGTFRSVALRKESVDRNYIIKITKNTPAAVALRKESVDRNRTPHHRNTRPIPSLSARRAWIEISWLRI